MSHTITNVTITNDFMLQLGCMKSPTGNILYLPDENSTIVGNNTSIALYNKTIDCGMNAIENIDNNCISASAGIDASKIADGSINNIEYQCLSGVTSLVVGVDDTQTLTNKTISAHNNILGNIVNGNISTTAGIDASKIHDGTVSNTEFAYLNGVTSSIQTQLDSKSANSHTHVSTNITDFDTSVDGRITLQKGAVNGLASLNGSGKIPATQLDLDSVDYQGTWNANTNTPTITSSTGTKGHYYVVSISGTTTIDGINDWQTGDWIIFNGTVWEKSDHTDQVTSVAGKQGAVTLEASDITSGTFSNNRISESSVTQHSTALETLINHDNLLGFVSDEHVDHSLIYIHGGEGISGSGSITSNVTLNIDINGLTADSNPDKDSDYVVTYDASAGSHKKVLLDNLPGSSAVVDTVTTTDSTVTTIATIATSSDTTYSLDIQIAGRRTDSGSESATYFIHALFRNNGGTLTKVSDDTLAIEDTPQWNSDVAVSGTNILIRVTGQTSKTVNWKSSYRMISV